MFDRGGSLLLRAIVDVGITGLSFLSVVKLAAVAPQRICCWSPIGFSALAVADATMFDTFAVAKNFDISCRIT